MIVVAICDRVTGRRDERGQIRDKERGGLDLSELVKAYRGSGIASYHPAMLLGLPRFDLAIGRQSFIV